MERNGKKLEKKLRETESWFFRKINEIDKFLFK